MRMTRTIRFIPILATAAALLLSAMPALADKTTLSVQGDVSGTLGLTSDYRFRGISRSFGDPAIQGGAELTLPSNFYVGTWASIVDKTTFANTRGFEWDIYAGLRRNVGEGVTIDAGLIQYMFPTESFYSTLEGYVGANWKWFTVKFHNAFSNRFFGTENAKHSRYLSLSARYPVMPDLHIIAHVGNQLIAGNDGDHIDYRLGLEKAWKGLTWGASFYGTDVDVATTNVAGRTVNLGGRKFVASVSKTF